MKYTLTRQGICLLGLSLIFTFVGIPVSSHDRNDLSEINKQQDEARKEATEATATFREITQTPGKSIPRSLVKKAEAVAVFTNVKKGGFILGGTGGDGVIVRRVGNKWSAPVFYNIGGADVGLQVGVKESDIIMLFMQPGALKDLLDDDLELGASVSVAAGPVGEDATAVTGVTGNEAMLVYSNSGGAFAGATVGGAKISADNSRNKAFYKMKGGEVLTNPEKFDVSKLPAELQGFTNAVAQYAK